MRRLKWGKGIESSDKCVDLNQKAFADFEQQMSDTSTYVFAIIKEEIRRNIQDQSIKLQSQIDMYHNKRGNLSEGIDLVNAKVIIGKRQGEIFFDNDYLDFRLSHIESDKEGKIFVVFQKDIDPGFADKVGPNKNELLSLLLKNEKVEFNIPDIVDFIYKNLEELYNNQTASENGYNVLIEDNKAKIVKHISISSFSNMENIRLFKGLMLMLEDSAYIKKVIKLEGKYQLLLANSDEFEVQFERNGITINGFLNCADKIIKFEKLFNQVVLKNLNVKKDNSLKSNIQTKKRRKSLREFLNTEVDKLVETDDTVRVDHDFDTGLKSTGISLEQFVNKEVDERYIDHITMFINDKMTKQIVKELLSYLLFFIMDKIRVRKVELEKSNYLKDKIELFNKISQGDMMEMMKFCYEEILDNKEFLNKRRNAYLKYMRKLITKNYHIESLGMKKIVSLEAKEIDEETAHFTDLMYSNDGYIYVSARKSDTNEIFYERYNNGEKTGETKVNRGLITRYNPYDNSIFCCVQKRKSFELFDAPFKGDDIQFFKDQSFWIKDNIDMMLTDSYYLFKLGSTLYWRLKIGGKEGKVIVLDEYKDYCISNQSDWFIKAKKEDILFENLKDKRSVNFWTCIPDCENIFAMTSDGDKIVIIYMKQDEFHVANLKISGGGIGIEKNTNDDGILDFNSDEDEKKQDNFRTFEDDDEDSVSPFVKEEITIEGTSTDISQFGHIDIIKLIKSKKMFISPNGEYFVFLNGNKVLLFKQSDNEIKLFGVQSYHGIKNIHSVAFNKDNTKMALRDANDIYEIDLRFVEFLQGEYSFSKKKSKVVDDKIKKTSEIDTHSIY